MRWPAYLCIIIVAASPCAAQVIISEVMFNPVGPEATDEYLEIFNLSSQDSINLSGFRIGDQDAQEELVSAGQGLMLPPGGYAVVFDSDYAVSTGNYADLIPREALLLFVDDKTIGSAGLSNSRPETILLINAAGDTISAYTYTEDNPAGYSDEKIDLFGDDRAENWANSLVVNGTPGRRNSVAPKLRDVAIGFAQPAASSARPRMGAATEIHLLIQNLGNLSADHITGLLKIVSGKTLSRYTIPKLASGADTLLSLGWTPDTAGTIALSGEIFFSGDEDTTNNRTETVLRISWPKHSVILNEIMYFPGSGVPEWVELYNPSERPIPLAAWGIRDAAGKRGFAESAGSVALLPGHYALLSSEAILENIYPIPGGVSILVLRGFPSLNNSTDTVTLLDFTGAPIDSMAYVHTAGQEKGVSLERRWYDRPAWDPANWGYSVDETGATPGRFNSISPLANDLAIDSTQIQPGLLLAVRDQSLMLDVPVLNLGRNKVTLVSASFAVDLDGDGFISMMETIEQLEPEINMPPDASTTVRFQWRPSRSGYLNAQITIQASADDRPVNNRHGFILPVGYLMRDLVINEIMAVPLEGEPEWVELYNRGDQAVAFAGWAFADLSSISGRITEPVMLLPGEYAIFAQDSISTPPGVPLLVMSHWPSLNNTTDALAVYDFQGGVIDSLVYEIGPGSAAGVSLERINPNIPSTEASNWAGHVTAAGASPGTRNSVYAEVTPARTALAVSPNPFSPDGDGKDEVAVISYKIPFLSSRVMLKIYDMRGRLVRQILNNAPSGAQRHLIWDGRSDEGRILPVGIYVVYLEAIAAEQGKISSARETVVLAGKL